MSGTSDYKKMLSENLSEVLDDIGVNEELVLIRRRGMMLRETLYTLTDDVANIYHFGSQTEGSLTPGLNSDIDTLYYVRKNNLILDMSEWESGFEKTFLMLQNDAMLSPGYCFLQLISSDSPIPATINNVNRKNFNDESFLNKLASDNEGNLFVKNTIFQHNPNKTGPAKTLLLPYSQTEADFVQSYYCKSTLHQVDTWLQKQEKCEWPGKDVLDKCSKSGCFVVAVGGKLSSYPELEWRISTSLQERYLMFSLKKTQLHCYTLMKTILKTHINPHVKDVLSSFMCKNVLWHCITHSPHDWHSGSLLSYLHVCLVRLKECIEKSNCPHFIIPENNLLTGKMTEEQRQKLLEIMDDMLKNDEQMLLQIQIDDLGRRLQIKLGCLPACSGIPTAKNIAYQVVTESVSSVCDPTKHFYKHINGSKPVQDQLSVSLSNLMKYSTLEKDNEAFPHTDIETLHTACRLLIPIISSTLGSVLASKDIACNQIVSDRAIKYLEEGRHSDLLSGRLKLISVLYCSGDMAKTERELKAIKTLYIDKQLLPSVSVCPCHSTAMLHKDKEHELVVQACKGNILKTNQSYTVCCTRFLGCQINCVPQELRYELLKSFTEEDRQIRTWEESLWMDNMVVDSFPYLLFLQFKIYGRLKRRREQEKHLELLRLFTVYEQNQTHKETSLNLLGQCYEQENQPEAALQCYIDSLKHRRRNNAATWLLCLLLFKRWKQQNQQ